MDDGPGRAWSAVLSTLMIMIPIGQGQAFADSGADYGQQSQQPMSADQLDQLVAPIAPYPDALVAQVLAAATYPTQVVEADRWLRAEGNASPQRVNADAENQNWDPSVKALTAFPAGAGANGPQHSVDNRPGQRLLQPAARCDGFYPGAAPECGSREVSCRSRPQQVVSNDSGAITIVPANPTVVYVPTYDPWTVYGAPIAVYPGYYYAPAYGSFWGGLAVSFSELATAVGFSFTGAGDGAIGEWDGKTTPFSTTAPTTLQYDGNQPRVQPSGRPVPELCRAWSLFIAWWIQPSGRKLCQTPATVARLARTGLATTDALAE